MRTFQSPNQPAQRGAPSSLHSLSGSAMTPLSTASITLAALLLLTIPVCKNMIPADGDLLKLTVNTEGGAMEHQQVIRDQRQLISQIDAVCSSYLSADLKFWASDVLGELCVLMLVQKSKELKAQENTKRTPVLHAILHLVSQLHTRRERGLSARAEMQGPGGIQSRGYFLYRPRNGRRSLEYE